MDTKNICYTGVGSLKTGNHTQKQYLEVMNKNYKKKCSVYIKSLKCKSCKKSIEMNTKEVKKQIKAHLKNKTYKMSNKTEGDLLRAMRILSADLTRQKKHTHAFSLAGLNSI